jgi:hypothetical protein
VDGFDRTPVSGMASIGYKVYDIEKHRYLGASKFEYKFYSANRARSYIRSILKERPVGFKLEIHKVEEITLTKEIEVVP